MLSRSELSEISRKPFLGFVGNGQQRLKVEYWQGIPFASRPLSDALHAFRGNPLDARNRPIISHKNTYALSVLTCIETGNPKRKIDLRTFARLPEIVKFIQHG